jgi:hypothetical protein
MRGIAGILGIYAEEDVNSIQVSGRLRRSA